MTVFRFMAHLVLALPLLCVTTLSSADSAEGASWPRVVGGTTSAANAFPWTVALVAPVSMGGAQFCGSSLIAPQWLLTAAHCLFVPGTGVPETTATIEALLGTNDTTTGGVRIPITQIIVHESYDNNSPQVQDDIALLQLAQPATQITVPLLTPATETLANPGTAATVAGWGGTDPNDIQNSFSNLLLQVDLPVSTDAECDGVSNNNSQTQLCAGGVFNQDACPGDSGGPLIVPNVLNGTGHFALAGVVSYGATSVPPCGVVGFPGVYTRVSRYNDWILPKIAGGTATGLVASVLPTSRSVTVGQAATAFATIINSGPGQATGCRILGPAGLSDATFTFNTTDFNNVPNGTENAPFNIDGNNGSQSLVFALTRTLAMGSTQLQLGFDCENTVPADTITGLTTLLFSASATPTPDIITLPATAGSIPGVVDISGATGTKAFAVATANVGSGGDITVSARPGQAALPLTLSVCETTNAPVLGQCLAPPAPSVTTTIAAGATPTFSIFAQGSGQIASDFATNRIFVSFSDSGGTVRGGTSVAVQTVP